MTTRRNFIRSAVAGGAMLSVGGVLEGFSANSYNRIVGANDRIRLAGIGVHSRGLALATNFAKQKDCSITALCDVDSQSLAKCAEKVQTVCGEKVKNTYKDLRKMLESKDIDAVFIATPDHWHAPAALLALKAGKHVYLEKPCSYAPAEGEMLVKAADIYNRKLQMGNQRRSWPNVALAIQKLHEGVIGQVHFARSWYSADRPSIGIGKPAQVPEWLDWDLWQGPAPRRPFKDNIVHYNWHWFWHWGTGEALNNGTHMVDLMRWGLQAEYPTKVSSIGGRYFFKDDWEAPDTQIINIEFGPSKSLVWEGKSCYGLKEWGCAVGAVFYGEKGNLVITSGNEYKIVDLNGKVLEEAKSNIAVDPQNVMNPAEKLDSFHFQNFFDAIRKGTPLASNIDSGYKSTLCVQLGNISQRVGHSLSIDPTNGHILNDDMAERLFSRDYEPGWEMKL